jgi:hypothetical protein
MYLGLGELCPHAGDATPDKVHMATHSYDNGGQSDGTLTVGEPASLYGDYVGILLESSDISVHAYFTADEARALAADILAHANMLDKPSEEDKIRDAMTEARDHPGRIVTR